MNRGWDRQNGSMQTDQPRWRGINHLALVTDDMDTTVRFYVGVLGMDLVGAVRAGPARHYFFQLGEQNTIAFFEWPNHETREHAAGAMPPAGAQLDHIAFNLPDEDALESLRKRLLEHQCEVTPVIDHGFVRSVYFSDPNGIALEASWWVIDATGRDPDLDDVRLFSDPDPVPAIEELRERGSVEVTASTRLI